MLHYLIRRLDLLQDHSHVDHRERINFKFTNCCKSGQILELVLTKKVRKATQQDQIKLRKQNKRPNVFVRVLTYIRELEEMKIE